MDLLETNFIISVLFTSSDVLKYEQNPENLQLISEL